MKTYNEALAKAQEVESTLSAYDFKGDQLVHVQEEHAEGQFMVRSAFALSFDNWWLVFSEHHKPMVFCKEEVSWIAVYKVEPTDPPDVDTFVPYPKVKKPWPRK